MAEGLETLAARMPRVTGEREIIRVATALLGADAARTAEKARREVLVWVENRSGGRLPSDAWKIDSYEYLVGGRNSAAVRVCDDKHDIWAIRADDPDKKVPQRTWTTEVTVAFRQGKQALLSVRLLASSPEQTLDIQPSVPGFVQQIAELCGMESGGTALKATPWIIGSAQEAESLADLLVDPTRTIPILVLTVPDYAVDPSRPIVDSITLAQKTVGIASVVVVPSPYTWTLTDRFGKKLSVFGGAARAYLGGFAEDADPYGSHKLFLAERAITPVGAVEVQVEMQQIAASESLRRLRLDHDVLSFATVRSGNLEKTRERLRNEGAEPQQQLSAAQRVIAALNDDVKRAAATEQWLSDEQAAAEARAIAAETQLSVATYRIQQLLEQLKARGEGPDANVPLPASWDTFGDWCDQNLVGRVLLSPRARREVKRPAFRDMEIAARSLLWLANDYRERRLVGGVGDLRIPLEGGIQNDRCGADSFSMEWRGRTLDVEWHIKNGGNTRDPSRCLRIYYFWDEIDRQVVIASKPAHVASGAS
jgi:hypothetical protein